MLVNSRPSRIVSTGPSFRPSRSPWISEWCAQVTVVPEHSRISVLSSGKPHGSSTSMPLGGHCAADRLDRGREQRAVEEGPEPGEEEHHFRGDEQDHPVAQVKLDDRRVIAGVRFADGVRPPAEHGDQHAERRRAARRTCRSGLSCNHITAPPNRTQRREGADQRPGIGLDEMVIVVLGRGHVVRLSSFVCGGL